MYADVTGTIVTLQVLYGVRATERGGNDYYASTIPRFIHMNILNQTRKHHELQDQRVLYIEPSDTDPTGYFIATKPATSFTMNRGLNTSINLSTTPMTHALMVIATTAADIFKT
ncbi:hypothetical protein AC1031_016388 [Aphanomyces cochlioides]|nr:hypothetical protein AC1031_016388 [Aphanomyces cochlioides]